MIKLPIVGEMHPSARWMKSGAVLKAVNGFGFATQQRLMTLGQGQNRGFA